LWVFSYFLDLTILSFTAGPIIGSSSSSSVLEELGSLPSDTLTSLNALAAGPSVEPSATALQTHMGDLEMELRNTEFRLQYLFQQRVSLLSLLSMAKSQANNLNK
jgi:hypothetical protein